ncbi:MAG: DUF4238 domain-containing protein [bacterium]
MTVQETKKQHFLPFVYLKYFRRSEKVASREKATILRDDGNSVTEEKVANQCYVRWFYKKENTTESEAAFQIYENDWDEVVARVHAGYEESALIFLQMVLYHFRNLSIRMLSDEIGRFDAVQGSVCAFVEQKIMRLSDGVHFTDEDAHVTNFPWETRIVKLEAPILLTSDNPSVMTITDKTKEKYGPFFLPISPSELLVAIDKSKYRFKSHNGNIHDGYIANAYVAAQGLRHLYYSQPMIDSQRKDLWMFIERNGADKGDRGSFEHNIFVPGHPLYGDKNNQKFQFLQEIT